MRNVRKLFLVAALGFSTSIIGGAAMAGKDGMQFAVNGSSTGNVVTSVKVENGHYTMTMRGDTFDAKMAGFGVFEGQVDAETESQFEALRNSAPPGGPYTSWTQVNKYLHSFYANGTKLAKLDVTGTIAPRDGRLVLTLEFQNSGKSEVVFRSPATWEGIFNPINGNSWILVTGVRSDNLKKHEKELEFDTSWFGGQALLNRADFPDDVVRIQPGQIRRANFLVWPSNPFKMGRYLLGITVAIREVLAPQALKGSVEFVAPDTYVEFTQDYPTTHEEHAAFATHLREQSQ
ncbi:hypothetical protein [Paraburkholderia sp. BL6669N2]|uniref:hypothetical protein n=1 Tax=Paraburkholderia sp. BL6669N2 TaxID=1938807 RepID=UPI0011C0815C|nr:hypothetical protein [Paraburkholderia sp. BL6669N2]